MRQNVSSTSLDEQPSRLFRLLTQFISADLMTHCRRPERQPPASSRTYVMILPFLEGQSRTLKQRGWLDPHNLAVHPSTSFGWRHQRLGLPLPAFSLSAHHTRAPNNGPQHIWEAQVNMRHLLGIVCNGANRIASALVIVCKQLQVPPLSIGSDANRPPEPVLVGTPLCTRVCIGN